MEVKKKKKEKGERDTQFYYVCWISSFVIPLARSAVFVVGISICLFFPLSLPMSDLLLISTQTLCEEKLVVVLTLPVYFSLSVELEQAVRLCVEALMTEKKDVKNKYEFRYWVGFVRGRQGKKARLLPLFERLSADKLNCSDTTLHDELSSVCDVNQTQNLHAIIETLYQRGISLLKMQIFRFMSLLAAALHNWNLNRTWHNDKLIYHPPKSSRAQIHTTIK